ncbi:MAG: hypothetical protein AAF289_03230 [Cyanobacteria bacterium P01_A01_bin.135]
MKDAVSRFEPGNASRSVTAGSTLPYLAASGGVTLGATLVFDCATAISRLYSNLPAAEDPSSGAALQPDSAQSSQAAIAAYPYIQVDLGDTGHHLHKDHLNQGQGEFHLVNAGHTRRLATLMPIPVLGNGQQGYRPWHTTYAYLASMFDWDDLSKAYGKTDLLQFLCAQGSAAALHCETVTAPRSSACRYLCDAVAAAIGLGEQCSFLKGQGDWHLRSALTPSALRSAGADPYQFRIRLLHHRNQPQPYLDPRPMWQQLLEDLQEQAPASVMASRFYLGLIQGVADLLGLLAETHAVEAIAISGRMLQHPTLGNAAVRSLLARMAPTAQVA